MDPRYTTREDVARRLDNSIVRYKGTYYYAKLDREESLDLLLYDLSTSKPFTKVSANDIELDISSPELGYCHCLGPELAVFIRRVPYRRQKQGASNENMVYTMHKDERRRGVENSHIITRFFKDMLDGSYKEYKDCLAYFNDTKNDGKTSCLAFSRDFAIGRQTPKQSNLNIYYQNVCIGQILKSKTDIFHKTSLSPEYDNSVFIHNLARYGAMNA